MNTDNKGSGVPPDQPGKPGTGTPEDTKTPAPVVEDQREGKHSPGDEPAEEDE